MEIGQVQINILIWGKFQGLLKNSETYFLELGFYFGTIFKSTDGDFSQMENSRNTNTFSLSFSKI